MFALTMIFVNGDRVNALLANNGTELPDLPTGNNTTDYYAIINVASTGKTRLIYYDQKDIWQIDNKTPAIMAKMGNFGGYESGSNKRQVYCYELVGSGWLYKGYGSYGAGISLPQDYLNQASDGDYGPAIKHIKQYILDSNVYLFYDFSSFSSSLSDELVHDLAPFELKIMDYNAEENGKEIVIIKIDAQDCFKSGYKYQYSYDGQKYYNLDINAENLVVYLPVYIDLNPYFRILDSSNNLVWELDYTLKNYNTVARNILITEVAEFAGGSKQVKTTINFTDYSQFSDKYNLKYIINGEEKSDVVEYIVNAANYESMPESLIIEVYLDDLLLKKETHRLTMVSHLIDFNEFFDDILDKNMSDELGNEDLSNVNGWIKMVVNFLDKIGNTIKDFFALILHFFNKLNVWIRTSTIGLFIILVITRIIKAVRK